MIEYVFEIKMFYFCFYDEISMMMLMMFEIEMTIVEIVTPILIVRNS